MPFKNDISAIRYIRHVIYTYVVCHKTNPNLMTKNDNKWKDFLLKSGVPLEFEIKKILKDLGFDSYSEHSYLRKDENNIVNEFSYDINSTLKIDNQLFELMVECKYRDESTNWIFIPEEYNESDRGAGTMSFLNTNDFFYKKEFPDFYKLINFDILAPLCSKGIEINSSGQNPKTITQALHQLCYGIIDKVTEGMKQQLDENEDTEHLIFHHIPIIITTANLYRLKNSVTISEIKNADNFESIATREYMLLLEPKISLELEKYSYQKLDFFINEYGIEKLNSKLHKKNKIHNWTFKDHQKMISRDYPEGILVIQHEQDNKGLSALIKILNEIARPSKKYQVLNDLIKDWKKTGKNIDNE